jgi:hypothetical protein
VNTTINANRRAFTASPRKSVRGFSLLGVEDQLAKVRLEDHLVDQACAPIAGDDQVILVDDARFQELAFEPVDRIGREG